jgi:hypothetical protein
MIQHLRHEFVASCDDTDIVWAIHLYRERRQIAWCLPLLRAQYPASRVVLINDGDDEDYEDLAQAFACDYVRGEHLCQLSTCHLYVRRMLCALSRGSETYCVKIDPDTRVWRRFSVLPGFSSMFGTLETITELHREEISVPANVQGGCMGMTRDVVEAMLASDLLTEEYCVTRCLETWTRCRDMVLTVRQGRFCDDFVLSWLAHRLAIPIVESPDIRSRWRRTVSNPDLRYAITHPHKLAIP